MAHNTPAEWLERELEKADLMAQAARPIDYLLCGEGHTWLLAQFDGLRALAANCLAHHQPVLLTSQPTEPLAD